MPQSPCPTRLDASSIVGGATRPLADSVLLEGTPPATVLALVGHGLLGLDAAWEPVRLEEQGKAVPRIIHWAGTAGLGNPSWVLPSHAGWQLLQGGGGAQELPKFTDGDRVLAWAFSDARAWDAMDVPGKAGGSLRAVDWAVGKGRAWAVDAALRQPGRADPGAEWFAQAIVRALAKGSLLTLRVVAAHGQLDINTVRAVPTNNRTGSSRLRADALGRPLLHLAGREDEIRALLELGADPSAKDGNGMRADEYWASEEGRSAGLGKDLAGRVSLLSRGTLAPDEGLAQAAHLHCFHMVDTKAFGQWLAQQPRDLVVGPDQQLPFQALWQGPGEHEDKTKRSEMLVEHMAATALDRVGSDGVPEWHTAWWLALLSRFKRNGTTLARCLPQVMVEGAWQQALGSGLLLANRANRSTSWPYDMTKRSMDLVGHLAAQSLGQDANLLPFPDKALVRPAGGWAGLGTGAVDLAMGIAADLAEHAGLAGFSPDMSISLDWVRRHLGANHVNEDGSPRHGLLDACVRLWAQAGGSDSCVAQSTLEEIIEALLESGAAPERGSLGKLEACVAPGAQELHARALEACLGVRLAPGGGAGDRPRM